MKAQFNLLKQENESNKKISQNYKSESKNLYSNVQDLSNTIAQLNGRANANQEEIQALKVDKGENLNNIDFLNNRIAKL